MKNGINKVDEHLYGVILSESAAVRSLSMIPKEEIFKIMARELLPAVIENMEVTSYRSHEDPYVIRNAARVFIAKPSEIFECHTIDKTGEIVVLNYKGFTKRVVVPKASYRWEFQEMEPLSLVEMQEPLAELTFKRLEFCDEGKRNAVGERIFEYQWPTKEVKKKIRR